MRLDNYTRKTLSVQITCNYQYGKSERELGVWRIFDKNIGICTINEAITINFNEIKQYYAVKFKPILRQINILICFITPKQEKAQLENPYKDFQGAMLIGEKFCIDVEYGRNNQSKEIFFSSSTFEYIKTIYDFLDINLYNEDILEKFKEKCCNVCHKNKRKYLKVNILKFLYFCNEIGYKWLQHH